MSNVMYVIRWIKLFLIYFRHYFLRFIVKGRFSSYYLNKSTKISVVSKEYSYNFFGYYGFKISNFKNEIIFLNGNKKSKKVNIIHQIGKKHKVIGTSSAWNWQQGCMQQWLSISGNKVIYNDYDQISNKLCSRIIDINGNLISTISKPIQVVNETGKFALTLNFEKLSHLRPEYGYNIDFIDKKNTKSEDGIWYINLETGKDKLIINIKQIIEKFPHEHIISNTHKLNHIILSPSGDKFIFLHRWTTKVGRFHRLFISNVDGTDIKLLNSHMTSHCCWIDDSSILAFCQVDNDQLGYYIFNIETSTYNLFSRNLPREDGHPVAFGDGKYLIVDTYPDLSGYAKLFLLLINQDKLIEIGSFYQPLIYNGGRRIDLHPKLSFDEKKIYIESGHRKLRRLLYEIDLTVLLQS